MVAGGAVEGLLGQPAQLGHVGGGRARTRAVDEAEAGVEADLLDQLHRRLEILCGLAGKTDDERRPQRNARHTGADAFEEVHDELLRGFTPHPLEHVFVNVL